MFLSPVIKYLPAYIDCKWFAYAGWQEGDNNCNNYRQYTLGETADGFVYYVERVNNYVNYYETDNYLELGFV